jgi:glycerol-3-phosphate dehydrogenase
LAIQLTQKYRIPHAVSSHLVKSYAGNAEKVITIAMETEKNDHFPQKLLPNFPYIEAEILYAIRNEWAVHAEDIIARRLRIAFLNTESTKKIIPKVVKIMANELHWNEQRQQEEIQQCVDFLQHFGGPKPISK